MPRPPRLNLVGIPQHITQRGNNRQACFFLTEDRLTYLKLMDRAHGAGRGSSLAMRCLLSTFR